MGCTVLLKTQLNLVKYPFHRTELVNPTMGVMYADEEGEPVGNGGLGYGGFYLMGKGVYYDKGRVLCCCLEWELYI